jgi:hypothetical protein
MADFMFSLTDCESQLDFDFDFDFDEQCPV